MINLLNTEPAPQQPEDIFARLASFCGHTVDKKLLARLVAAEKADKKRLAVITELGIGGVRRMAAEQDRAIVAAAEKGETLPHAVRSEPDMLWAIEQQQAALKEDRAKVNAACWPDILAAWRAFFEACKPRVDELEDNERELAHRFGLDFEPSATLRALRHALAVAEKRMEPPANLERLNGSVLQPLAGLVQV